MVSVIVDYKWSLSGIDPDSAEYVETKSQVSYLFLLRVGSTPLGILDPHFGVKKFATTTEEIRGILRLVANFTGTGENEVGGGNLDIRERALRLPSDLNHFDIFCSSGSARQNALFR